MNHMIYRNAEGRTFIKGSADFASMCDDATLMDRDGSGRQVVAVIAASGVAYTIATGIDVAAELAAIGADDVEVSEQKWSFSWYDAALSER